ncbi:MAG: hypothetical protein E7456_01345 [Ruminococcaceae bacterium]|nr:hypothetical protein [Oscillospiraceae bacterium]
MEFKDYLSIFSLLVSVTALTYSILSNTKKYELTNQYFNDVLKWHNQVVEVLVHLRVYCSNSELKTKHLAQLSVLIENGRFYFPNTETDKGIGRSKSKAYQGLRHGVLDLLVYEHRLFSGDDCVNHLEHAEALQKLFTSKIFEHLDPGGRNVRIEKNTSIKNPENMDLHELFELPADEIYKFFR